MTIRTAYSSDRAQLSAASYHWTSTKVRPKSVQYGSAADDMPSMMLLWAFAGIPLGVYNILAAHSVALVVQAQILTALSLATWSQCMYYGHVRLFPGHRKRPSLAQKWAIAKAALVVCCLATLGAAVEVALVFGLRVRSIELATLQLSVNGQTGSLPRRDTLFCPDRLRRPVSRRSWTRRPASLLGYLYSSLCPWHKLPLRRSRCCWRRLLSGRCRCAASCALR